jgi:hypothetical protein
MAGAAGTEHEAQQPNRAATLTAPVRSVLLATLMLLLAAPAADAATTVTLAGPSTETTFGETTTLHGMVTTDGAPAAGVDVALEGRRYPFESPFAALAHATSGADGSFTFERALDRNWQFRVTTPDAKSHRVHTYVFPFTTLTFRARSSRVIKLTQRYRVPKAVRLKEPTLFYVAKHGRKSAPRVASAKLERIRAGHYTSSAVVRLPKAWHGRFRYASCFRYTGGSGMGNPRAGCPARFSFR